MLNYIQNLDGKMNFELGIEVDLNKPTGGEPFCSFLAKRLQRKARPAGKRTKKD